jgi:hypothetical protein
MCRMNHKKDHMRLIVSAYLAGMCRRHNAASRKCKHTMTSQCSWCARSPFMIFICGKSQRIATTPVIYLVWRHSSKQRVEARLPNSSWHLMYVDDLGNFIGFKTSVRYFSAIMIGSNVPWDKRISRFGVISRKYLTGYLSGYLIPSMWETYHFPKTCITSMEN